RDPLPVRRHVLREQGGTACRQRLRKRRRGQRAPPDDRRDRPLAGRAGDPLRGGLMADDWRVTATLHEEGLVEKLLDRLRRHDVEDEVVARLGGRVAVSTGPGAVFVYADSEGAAREAERLLREVSGAAVTVERWHPIEERWEDPRTPLPQTEAERAEE